MVEGEKDERGQGGRLPEGAARPFELGCRPFSMRPIGVVEEA